MEAERWLTLSLRSLVDWRILTKRGAARLLGWLERQQARLGERDLTDPAELPGVFGLAVGKKHGQKASVGVAFKEVSDVGMGHATGVPLACGLELLARGQITQRGVFAPESGVIDPLAFFDLLATHYPEKKTQDKANLEFRRSWEA